MYMITQAIAPKIIDIQGFYMTVALITFPICTIMADISTEVYGFNRTRKMIWTVLICGILFGVFTQLAVAIPSADFWQGQDSFASTFQLRMRLTIAGLVAWLVGELCNSFIMSKMKIMQNGKNTSYRFIGSTAVGQFFDTLCFYPIAFLGTMSLENLLSIMIVAWFAKIMFEVLALPISIPLTKKLKHLEGVEHFDKQKISAI